MTCSATVQTQHGPVSGCLKTSILGREYYSFQKIPYMKSPVGKLRFVDPQVPDKWTEPLDCTKEGPPFCNVFFKDNKYQGELSGVHINVYTTNLNPKSPHPVLVSIHSGGIITGNATEDFNGPDYLLQKDVVLVTFQYRIGVFGFLSLDDPELNIPGNAQFRDHVMALKWIQTNIGNFGGDAGNVTLFGESWGGGSTCYHMMSSMSKGLFHRAILMSGTAHNNLYTFMPRRNWALKLCQKLGYEGTSDDKSVLEFLEAADEHEIVTVSAQVLTNEEKIKEGYFAAFGPTIETYDNGNAFLTDDIVKMARTAWGNEIDILIGNTSNEALMLKDVLATVPAVFDDYKSFSRYIPRDLSLSIDCDENMKMELAEMLKNNYYGDKEVTAGNVDGILQAFNDVCLWHPMFRVISSRLVNGTGKSFAYRFDYVTSNNLIRASYKVDETVPDAAHGDDCSYIFRMKGMEYDNFSLPIDSLAFAGIKLMTSIFTNFARYGNPNVPELSDVEWTPVTLSSPFYGLNISEKGSKMIEFPEHKRIKVFNSFYPKLNMDLY